MKIIEYEFARYTIVGGTAFLLDFLLLYAAKTFVFKDFGIVGIYLSTAIGFFFGLMYNYILSFSFVFNCEKEYSKGKDFKSFMIFTAIGLIGLLITEIGMFIGVQLLEFYYLGVKAFVAVMVLIWNYVARKILIFEQVKEWTRKK